MMKSNTRHLGMSLIEMLIVVSVLGILAAIVIPRFSNASDEAKGGALASQVQVVKKALLRYKLDHNDAYPTEAQLVTAPWQALTSSTDVDGDTAGSDFGPYILKTPNNPFNTANTIATDNSAAWQYTPATGTIKAVVPQWIYDDASFYKLDTADLVVAP